MSISFHTWQISFSFKISWKMPKKLEEDLATVLKFSFLTFLRLIIGAG